MQCSRLNSEMLCAAHMPAGHEPFLARESGSSLGPGQVVDDLMPSNDNNLLTFLCLGKITHVPSLAHVLAHA